MVSKISQGLQGQRVEGAAVPPGRPCLTCPRANQGRAQSPRSLRGWARWHSRCQAPVHCLPMLSHAGCNLVLVHIPPRAGVQGLEPRSPRASHSEPLSLCQTVLGLSAQDCRTLDRWAGLVLLSSSGSPACPRYTVKDPAQSGRQHQDGPLPTPVLSLWGLVVQQSWGRRSSSSVQDAGPGPECTVGAPGQRPPLS